MYDKEILTHEKLQVTDFIYDNHILKWTYFVNFQANFFMNQVLSYEFYLNMFSLLTAAQRAAAIVECVRKYVDGIS